MDPETARCRRKQQRACSAWPEKWNPWVILDLHSVSPINGCGHSDTPPWPHHHWLFLRCRGREKGKTVRCSDKTADRRHCSGERAIVADGTRSHCRVQLINRRVPTKKRHYAKPNTYIRYRKRKANGRQRAARPPEQNIRNKTASLKERMERQAEWLDRCLFTLICLYLFIF